MANVNIRNKLPQSVQIVVADISGTLQIVDLGPFATHGPVDESRVGEHTKSLAKQGRLRIRTVA